MKTFFKRIETKRIENSLKELTRGHGSEFISVLFEVAKKKWLGQSTLQKRVELFAIKQRAKWSFCTLKCIVVLF